MITTILALGWIFVGWKLNDFWKDFRMPYSWNCPVDGCEASFRTGNKRYYKIARQVHIDYHAEKGEVIDAD